MLFSTRGKNTFFVHIIICLKQWFDFNCFITYINSDQKAINGGSHSNIRFLLDCKRWASHSDIHLRILNKDVSYWHPVWRLFKQEYAFSFELKTGSEIEDTEISLHLSERFRLLRNTKANYRDMATDTYSLLLCVTLIFL